MDSTADARTVAMDVRCLQDPEYARRGVGRHALALLQHAPRDAVRVVGLTDSSLPPLIEEARAALDDVHTNAYAASAAGERTHPPAAFVCLSPMTHAPLFAARLLADARLLRAAVVYDFIPHRFPERYLTDPAARLAYATRLRWLARCDLFAPISRGTADDLIGLLGVPEHAVAVTGAPIDPSFEAAPSRDHVPGPRGRAGLHVLVVGGADARKNVECAVRAHAGSDLLRRAGVALVITGGYCRADVDAIHALHGGGGPELRLPGHIPQRELVALYRDALCVVVPSRAEGFSLPVVEAMAAGVVTFVSDIPVHRELVEDPGLLFDPDDDAGLRGLIERAWADPAWRSAAVAKQAAIWPGFRAAEVAGRFWRGLAGRLDDATEARGDARPVACPAVGRGVRPRVAMLSPVPPDRSGIADYTAATCAELGKIVELHVFTATARPRSVPGAATVRPIDAFSHVTPRFDRVVDVIGNSHFHTRIFELLLRYGGACIAHDSRMLGFYRVLLGRERALEVAAKELGRAVSDAELEAWLADEGKLEALFLGEVAQSASPTVMHSSVAAGLFQKRYGKAPVHLPFSIYRPWTADELLPTRREAARARLGLVPGEVVVATFGFVHASKAPEECIWALETLRGWGVPANLHFVGGTGEMPDGGAGLRGLAERLGLATKVHFLSGFASEQRYRDYLAGADLGVQLRTYGLGSVSGALMDCVAAGLPTAANASLCAAIDVPAAYTRCIPDHISPLLLAEALAYLLETGLTVERPEAARRAFCEERSFAAYSRGLCAALGLEAA